MKVWMTSRHTTDPGYWIYDLNTFPNKRNFYSFQNISNTNIFSWHIFLIYGNISLKKECFLSGIARITSPPPPPILGNFYLFFGRKNYVLGVWQQNTNHYNHGCNDYHFNFTLITNLTRMIRLSRFIRSKIFNRITKINIFTTITN